jgi:hypothetical protein
VLVRNGNAWTKFAGYQVDYKYGPPPKLGPTGLVYYAVDVTNLPPKSAVRFNIETEKELLGLSGLYRRVELKWELRAKSYAPSLNPYDTHSSVYGNAHDVKSDEFVEP